MKNHVENGIRKKKVYSENGIYRGVVIRPNTCELFAFGTYCASPIIRTVEQAQRRDVRSLKLYTYIHKVILDILEMR